MKQHEEKKEDGRSILPFFNTPYYRWENEREDHEKEKEESL